MRPTLPWLAAVYGLRWEHVEVMPQSELDEYVEALPDVLNRLSPRWATPTME